MEREIELASPSGSQQDGKKEQGETVIVEIDAEAGDGEKKQYSKLSVWLMVLYSGLAIGSDG